MSSFANPIELDPTETDTAQRLLESIRFLESGESVESIGQPGDGNMNLTLRVQTDRRSFIVKQARPWVEKYPSIPAPLDRHDHEVAFYSRISEFDSVRDCMPRLLAHDATNHLIILEDVSPANDCSICYRASNGSAMLWRWLPGLINWLEDLHSIEVAGTPLKNSALRQLNHDHMFSLPFQAEPLIDLDQVTAGLAEEQKRVANDRLLTDRIAELGQQYLEPDFSSSRLLHGDFFPGSWMVLESGQGAEQTRGQPRIFIIDPEFCFTGPPEFDWGVLQAHFVFTGEEIPASLIPESLDQSLLNGFAAAEVLRRLLGVAQLPLEKTLDEKVALVDWAVESLR
ncbi:MAG: phosphotransferase [Planctomycetota bacterium]